MKFIKILPLIAGLIFINIANAGEKAKVWDFYWKPGQENISYEVRNIDKSKFNPQGILDIVFAEYKKDAELYQKYENAGNYEKIRELIYSDKRPCFPKILAVKNETAYVNLEGDADFITQRSGTFGAECFAATIVLT